MKIAPCPIIKLANRAVFYSECESIYTFDSLFPFTGEKMINKQALHLHTRTNKLIDFVLAKVPKFVKEKPVFFLEFDKDIASDVYGILKDFCKVEDVSSDFEVLAATTTLSEFEEGERIFLEEEGNMVYDHEVEGSLTGYVSYVDPRSRSLGSRIITVEGCVESENPKDTNYYKMWRIMHGIAEGPSIRDSFADHLNFQYFNGEAGLQSEVSTYSGSVFSSGKDELDPNFNRSLLSLRVLDKSHKFIGKIFDQHLNFCLIKLFETPSSELFLETGEKINAWKPVYSA